MRAGTHRAGRPRQRRRHQQRRLEPLQQRGRRRGGSSLRQQAGHVAQDDAPQAQRRRRRGACRARAVAGPASRVARERSGRNRDGVEPRRHALPRALAHQRVPALGLPALAVRPPLEAGFGGSGDRGGRARWQRAALKLQLRRR
jgi:hypothetical protein